MAPESNACWFVALVVGLANCCWGQDADKPHTPPIVPKITIGKETTWATEPLKANGAIDYHAVVNRRFSRGVTAANNAVVPLYRAMGQTPGGGRLPEEFFEWLEMDSKDFEGVLFQPLGDWLRGHDKKFTNDEIHALEKSEDLSQERPWTEQEFPEIADWLRALDEPLRQVVEATYRTEYFSPLVADGADDPLLTVLLPGVQHSRSLARALVSRAMLRLGEERRFEAWQDLLAVHRLGRLMSRDSTIIGWLVGSAIEELAIGAELRFLVETQSPAKHLPFYRRDLQKLPPRSSLVDKLDVCERAMALEACWHIARGKITFGECIAAFGDDFICENQPLARRIAEAVLMQSADWNEVLKTVNQRFDRMIAEARLPTYRQRADSSRKLDRELKQLREKENDPVAWLAVLGDKPAMTQFVADLLIPAIFSPLSNKHQCEARIAQKFQNLETAMALATWHSDHGHYPKSLADLVPQYLVEHPQDLFTDRPLRYERTTDGYRFYSFGVNENDDDGRGHEDKPEGDDFTMRMPLPKPKVNQ